MIQHGNISHGNVTRRTLRILLVVATCFTRACHGISGAAVFPAVEQGRALQELVRVIEGVACPTDAGLPSLLRTAREPIHGLGTPNVVEDE